MKKINVSICTGANCNKTQATWYKQFDQILSPKMKSKIRMCGTGCPGTCAKNCSMAPQVRVNDQLFVRATPAEVKNAILTFA